MVVIENTALLVHGTQPASRDLASPLGAGKDDLRPRLSALRLAEVAVDGVRNGLTLPSTRQRKRVGVGGVDGAYEKTTERQI